MFDPAISASIEATMRALLDDVSRGFDYYVTGTVEASKALALATRFHERYDLMMDRKRRHRVRESGRAVFRLHLCPERNLTTVRFWLLRTDGRHPLLELEKWDGVKEKPIRWLWWYELVRLPVAVAHQLKYQNADGKIRIKSVTWTWRITRQAVDEMKQQIRRSAQHPDQRTVELVKSLSCAVGFRGVRLDVKGLYRYIQHQHKTHKTECPELKKTVRWVGDRKRVTKEPLSLVVGRKLKGRDWFC